MKAITSPWYIEFGKLVENTTKSLWIASAFVKLDAVKYMVAHLPQTQSSRELKLLIRGDLNDFLSGASDYQVLKYLHAEGVRKGWKVKVLAIRNLHAKVYISDSNTAIIGSGNLTSNGLLYNAELAIFTEEQKLIKQFQEWFNKAWSHGVPLNIETIEKYLQRKSQSRILQENMLLNASDIIEKSMTDGLEIEPEQRRRFIANRDIRHNHFYDVIKDSSPTQKKISPLKHIHHQKGSSNTDKDITLDKGLLEAYRLINALHSRIEQHKTKRKLIQLMKQLEHNHNIIFQISERVLENITSISGVSLEVLTTALKLLPKHLAVEIAWRGVAEVRIQLWREGFKFLTEHDSDETLRLIVGILHRLEPTDNKITVHPYWLERVFRRLNNLISQCTDFDANIELKVRNATDKFVGHPETVISNAATRFRRRWEHG